MLTLNNISYLKHIMMLTELEFSREIESVGDRQIDGWIDR